MRLATVFLNIIYVNKRATTSTEHLYQHQSPCIDHRKAHTQSCRHVSIREWHASMIMYGFAWTWVTRQACAWQISNRFFLFLLHDCYAFCDSSRKLQRILIRMTARLPSQYNLCSRTCRGFCKIHSKVCGQFNHHKAQTSMNSWNHLPLKASEDVGSGNTLHKLVSELIR